MLAILRPLAALLASDPLTVAEVVDYLGTVERDYGPNILVRPSNSAIREANVVRNVDARTLEGSDAPSHVTLTPEEPLEIRALADEFGDYTEIPAEEKIPAQLIFYVDMPGRPFSVALIAQLGRGKATTVTLRRDIPL